MQKFFKNVIEQRSPKQIDADVLAAKIKSISTYMQSKWRSSGQSRPKFERMFKTWLDTEFTLTEDEEEGSTTSSASSRDSSKSEVKNGPGRPKKSYEESKDRAQRGKLTELQKEVTEKEALELTRRYFYNKGQRAAADLIKSVAASTPSQPLKMRKILKKNPTNEVIPYTPEEAVALMIDNGLSKRKYQNLRNGAMKRNAKNLYPSYAKLAEAKKRCYPEGVIVDDLGAEVPLQSLLDHTASRLFETLNISENVENFLLVCKYGCDGSSGFNEYMQRKPENSVKTLLKRMHIRNENESEMEEFEGESESDSDVSPTVKPTYGNIFLFSMVPIQLRGVIDGAEKILWENPNPSSTRLCRPIKFLYLKETNDVTRALVNEIKKEVKGLRPGEFVWESKNKIVSVSYCMNFTMIDGKVISALTKIGCATCYICKCKPKDMNDLANAQERETEPANLAYGLSTLHGWLKFLDLILKVSYKQELKAPTKHNASKEQRDRMDAIKSEIRKRFENELQVSIDKRNPGQPGTSNTGNVARKVLKNAAKTSDITGFDEELIKRFHVIMTVLSAFHPIDAEAFRKYALETAQRFVEKYNWYRMPISVHKILIHGADVVRGAVVPIGMLSEEAQEASNKMYKRFRMSNCRKFSRLATTYDLMHLLLIESDPVTSFLRTSTLIQRARLELPQEALNLLQKDKEGPEYTIQGDNDDDEDEGEDNEEDEEDEDIDFF